MSTNQSAWWEEEKPKSPLPAHLQKLLRQEDPKFVSELEKFAFRFSSYIQEDATGRKFWRSFESHLRMKDASWLWTLYLETSPLARKGLKRILRYLSAEELRRLSEEIDQKSTWYGDYATYIYQMPLIPRTNQTKYSLTKNSIRFYPYLKAIYKLAEKKLDAEIWGILAYRFDIDSAYNLEKDGIFPDWKDRDDDFSEVYSSRTHYYLQRRSWRTLRKLAKEKPEQYVKFATQLLLQYQQEDEIPENILLSYKRRDRKVELEESTRPYLTLMRVLFHNSERFHFTGASTYLKSNHKEVDVTHVREEAFPEIWDQYPKQLLRILEHTEVGVIAQFAIKALQLGNAEILKDLDDDFLYRLLSSQLPQKQLFAAKVLLEKRAREGRTDTNLLMRFSLHSHPEIRKITFTYLQEQAKNVQPEELRFFVDSFVDYIVQEPNLPDDVIADWNDFLRDAGVEILPYVDSWRLVQGLASSEREVLQDLAVIVLRQLDPKKEKVTGEDILPYFTSSHPALREETRMFLHRHFTSLNLDHSFLVRFATIPGEEHQVFVTQFFTDRLLWIASFGKPLIQELWVQMLNRDQDSEVRAFLRDVLLGSLLFQELKDTPLEKVLRLIDSDEPELQDFGARLLQLIEPTPEQFTNEQLLELAHSRLAIARQVARELINQKIGELDEDFLISLIETEWDDIREWMFQYLKGLTSKQFTPRLIYGLLDTARSDIQKEAMQLVQKHEQELDLKELLLRASESTDLLVQTYACQLMEKVEFDLGTLKQLERFFRTVLMRVHAGRKAKKILLPQLLRLAEERQEYAEWIVPILSDMARVQDRGDFEKILFTITQIQYRFPDLKTPITIR